MGALTCSLEPAVCPSSRLKRLSFFMVHRIPLTLSLRQAYVHQHVLHLAGSRTRRHTKKIEKWNNLRCLGGFSH